MAQRTVNPKWVLVSSVIGSGTVFLESTVVNVAMPAMARGLGLSVAGLEWVANGYLLPLSALILLGGALGDHFGRARVFVIGSLGFAAATVACALAPTATFLVGARVFQGGAGALLVPNSLAMVEEAYPEEGRGSAIGQWAAWSSFTTALGPLLGGWLVTHAGWRAVFLIITPVALAAAIIGGRHAIPGSAAAARSGQSIDYAGAIAVTLGLGSVTGALIAGPTVGFGMWWVIMLALAGVALLAAFLRIEATQAHPLLPLDVFRVRAFTGANLTTLFVYTALSGLLFLLMLELQNVLGYGPLAAGASLLPVSALMLVISPRSGRLAQRIGPRWPMTLGSLIVAAGLALFARVGPDDSYVRTLLPATIVFGVGLSLVVAPLTSAVLSSVDDSLVGVASGVNNAVARVGGLFGSVALPVAAGLGALAQASGPAFHHGYVRAVWIASALCVVGALVAARTQKDRSRE